MGMRNRGALESPKIKLTGETTSPKHVFSDSLLVTHFGLCICGQWKGRKRKWDEIDKWRRWRAGKCESFWIGRPIVGPLDPIGKGSVEGKSKIITL